MELKDLDKTNHYIVAVSGGADSMALLDMLYQQGFHLTIAMMNYKTRPGSDIEQKIVETYAKEHHIDCIVEIAPPYKKGNFEAYAREVRYQFFAKVYQEKLASGLLVAHHLDDVLETYLIQKKRMAVVSYYGIQETREIRGMKVYRPLLSYYKEELLAYCISHQIPYHDDESNSSLVYQRNYLRFKVLANYSKKQKQELIKEINQANEQLALQQRKNEQNHQLCIVDHVLLLEPFAKLGKEEQLTLLYNWIKEELGNAKLTLTKSHLIDVLEQLLSNNPNLNFPINSNFILTKAYSRAFFEKTMYNIAYKYVILQGEYPACAFFSTSDFGHPYEGVFVEDKDYPLTIRPYQSGDKMKIKDGYKKVSRLFIDCKIPWNERKKWPILVNNENVILLIPWIAKDYDHHNKTDNFFIKMNHLEGMKNG